MELSAEEFEQSLEGLQQESFNSAKNEINNMLNSQDESIRCFCLLITININNKPTYKDEVQNAVEIIKYFGTCTLCELKNISLWLYFDSQIRWIVNVTMNENVTLTTLVHSFKKSLGSEWCIDLF